MYAQYPCKHCGHEGKKMVENVWICGSDVCHKKALGSLAMCSFCSKRPTRSMMYGKGVCGRFKCMYEATLLGGQDASVRL